MKNSDFLNNRSVFSNKLKKLVAAIGMLVIGVSAMAQEPYIFIEGSVHSFAVAENPNNTFAWSMDINPYTNVDLDPAAYTLLSGGNSHAVTVQFEDLNRAATELVYLVVEETAPNGCSTKRALQIELQPNNMYFDFAALPNADDCYNFDQNYFAEVQVGMNFLDRGGASDSAIPESRFPIQVKYTVEDKTNNPGVVVNGNSGDFVEILYSADNLYTLEVSEAKGDLTQTVEYELAITEVVDKYGTQITHDENRRVQIRIMNHLPQNGTMDMALAYMVTPIVYNGGM